VRIQLGAAQRAAGRERCDALATVGAEAWVLHASSVADVYEGRFRPR
jgi:hypothetical protein